jgi:hypothetical protein
MSSLQDGIEDSRSSLGRAELVPQNSTTVSSYEESAERFHKRRKQNSTPVGDLPNDDEINTVATSLSLDQSQIPTLEEQIFISQTKDPYSIQAPQLISWNQGVQGGLRTSFGSKSKSALPLVSDIVDKTLQALDGGEGVDADIGSVTIDSHEEKTELTAHVCSEQQGQPEGEPHTSIGCQTGIGSVEISNNNDTEDSVGGSDVDMDYTPGQIVRLNGPAGNLHDLLEGSAQTYRGEEKMANVVTKTTQGTAPQMKTWQTTNTIGGGSHNVYPRDVSEFATEFNFNQFRIMLPEMLKDGNAISLMNIGFRDFQEHLTRSNPEIRISNKKNKHLFESSFSAYISLYYGHYLGTTRLNSVAGIEIKPHRIKLKKPLKPPKEPFRKATREDLEGLPLAIAISIADEKSSVLKEPQTSFSTSEESVPAFTSINTRTPSAALPISQIGHQIVSAIEFGQSTSNDGDVSMEESSGHRVSKISREGLGLDTKEAERELQLKYFPGGYPSAARCLACADSGHETFDCPSLSCTLCGVYGHSNFTCPQNQRCGKCRQKGHSTQNCVEKLLASKAELGKCDICNSSDHLETSCHQIWRSFAPKPEDIRMVSGIPVHCYSCGAGGHYGSECGLHPRARILSSGVTWSSANLERYLDQNSRERAIACGVDYRIKKGFTVKGKADDPIDLDETDEEDNFIHPKINNPPNGSRGNGHIRFDQPSRDVPDTMSGRNSNRHPRRQAAPQFPQTSSYRQPQDDSARHGLERGFSPPPGLSYHGFHQGRGNEDRYNSYRPLPREPQHEQPPPTFTFPPAREPSNGSRGGRGRASRRGDRRGAANNVVAATEGKKKKKKKPKKAKGDRGGKA